MNLRKNKLTIIFDEHQGFIKDILLDASVVDDEAKEIERKEMSVKDIYDEKYDGEILFPKEHSYAQKLEFWINYKLNEVKKKFGIIED